MKQQIRPQVVYNTLNNIAKLIKLTITMSLKDRLNFSDTLLITTQYIVNKKIYNLVRNEQGQGNWVLE